MTHWSTQDPDGTIADCFDFDLGANPRLRWEVVDQDQDTPVPFTDHVPFDARNVAAMTQQLNASGRGPVVAAWNGTFFGYYPDGKTGFHVGPMVLAGKAHYLAKNNRWTFGVKYIQGKPRFEVLHQPTQPELEQNFDFAAGAVQYLVRDGKPMHLDRFPQAGEPLKKQPVLCTVKDAGAIPVFDFMRTSRASMAWSRDFKHLYLLTVKEPDDEGASAFHFLTRTPTFGGWMVSDVQHFWLAHKVWGAVNSDAGNVLQLVYRTPDGSYTMVPPRTTSGLMRVHLSPKFGNAPPKGGSISYFYIRETPLTR